MQMRKVLLVHISSSGCCNTFVTMLNNGDFWLSILFHSVWCRVFSAPQIALYRSHRLDNGDKFSTSTHSVTIAVQRIKYWRNIL